MDYVLLTLFLFFLVSQVQLLRLTQANKLKSVMIFEMRIEDQLSEIIRSTAVDRALLCKVHNGGGEITIGSTKKISVMVEPESSLSPHTKETYTNYPVDREYKQVILSIIHAKGTFVYNNVDQLRYGMLRRRTEADHISGVMHYFIRETRTGVYFVFLGTVGDPNELLGRPEFHNLIEEKIQAIRALCNTAARKRLLK